MQRSTLGRPPERTLARILGLPRTLVPPRFGPEPPKGYVAFVTRHLDALRADTRARLNDPREADDLYPEVLADVALSWPWLELARLRRPGSADRYLYQMLARRLAKVPAAAPTDAIEVRFEVWSGRPAGPGWAPDVVSIGGWDAPEPAPAGTAPAPRGEAVPGTAPVPGAEVVRSANAAVRLAPLLLPPDTPAAPIAEAAIAWWHGYQRRRLRRVLAVLVVVAVLLVVAFGYAQQDPSAGAAPRAPVPVSVTG